MPKTKKLKLSEIEERRKRDAYALAVLIYDIYQDYKRKGVNNGANIRQKP